MIYKWEKCPASTTADSSDCVSCIDWIFHKNQNPTCNCHKKFDDAIDPNEFSHLEKLSSTSGVACSKCNKNGSRDYPLYHIASSIIDSLSEVPNATHCESCRH